MDQVIDLSFAKKFLGLAFYFRVHVRAVTELAQPLRQKFGLQNKI